MVDIHHRGVSQLKTISPPVCICVSRALPLQPLRVNGVKVYTENVDKRQVIMDLQIRWVTLLNLLPLALGGSHQPSQSFLRLSTLSNAECLLFRLQKNVSTLCRYYAEHSKRYALTSSSCSPLFISVEVGIPHVWPVSVQMVIVRAALSLRLSFSPISFVGNTEIDVDIKKYYCRAGIKSIQVWLQWFYHLFRAAELRCFSSSHRKLNVCPVT